jgi:hypothetical protein
MLDGYCILICMPMIANVQERIIDKFKFKIEKYFVLNYATVLTTFEREIKMRQEQETRT